MSSIVKNITGAGDSGVNFRGQQADIISPFSAAQATNMYKQAQAAQAQQQAFLQAVQAQNGLGNQSSVFNQLQGVANGTGPNPAQAMLNNSTGQNVANQAALMAGQRGASQNVGLMARQAAQQGANTQQQAVGQGAAMQAQQSLNAMSGMGNIANAQAAQQAQATGANTSAAQNQENNVLNSINAGNNARVGMQSNVNNVNSSIAQLSGQDQLSTAHSLAGGLSGFPMLGAEGGQVPTKMADGGAIPGIPDATSPASSAGKYFNDDSLATVSMGSAATPLQIKKKSPMPSSPASGASPSSGLMAGGAGDAGGAAGAADTVAPMAMMVAAQGGKVPALLSPGEKYLSPKDVKKVEKGENPMEAGKTVPGKAKVKGDVNSYANDTIPASLDSGGIVLPRSVTQSKNPDKKAAEFVRAIMAKNGKKLPKKA